MDERLLKAAREGDVNTLHKLLEKEPQILQKESSLHFADSSLHVAARSGKTDFVKEILKLMPSLATERSEGGMTPLHLASLEGHIETVRELLKAKLDDLGERRKRQDLKHPCLEKDEKGWTALHWASKKGKITVIEELIKECPKSLEQVTAKRETVLHVAVKANEIEAVKWLADSIRTHEMNNLFKIQDQEGRTSYQLAEAMSLEFDLEVLKEDYRRERQDRIQAPEADGMPEERERIEEDVGMKEGEKSNKKGGKKMRKDESKSQRFCCSLCSRH